MISFLLISLINMIIFSHLADVQTQADMAQRYLQCVKTKGGPAGSFCPAPIHSGSKITVERRFPHGNVFLKSWLVLISIP